MTASLALVLCRKTK